MHSSDSGTDLNDCVSHDCETAWNKYWSTNGETIIWKSWISKYSDYINPEYLEYNGETKETLVETELPESNVQRRIKFSFDEKEIEEFSKQNNPSGASSSDSTKKHDVALRNRMLIRNLSGSDSFDKPHYDVSEGWNPLSPVSVEGETEAERLISSRCCSRTSGSLKTLDSMTNVTRMTVSSVDLSQSSANSDSFSSVSSLHSSVTSTSSEEAEEDNEQQWNTLWKKHYEEEYLEHYKKFIHSVHTQHSEKVHLENLQGMNFSQNFVFEL